MRILITGGCGFVGSSLALRCRAEWPAGEVVCLDNFHRQGAELNAERLRAAGVTVVRGDVRNRGDLDVGRCDAVIDAAAEPSVLAGQGDAAAYVVDTNLVGTVNTLEWARRWQCRLVFLSTSRVYPVERLRAIRLVESGDRFAATDGQSLPGVGPEGISEEFPVDGARTLYGATRYASEIMVQEYAAQLGLDAVINRCGVLAGPWQMGKEDQGVITLWVARHLYGLPLKYIGYGGRQVRDVLHIADLEDLVVQQLRWSESLGGARVAIGGGLDVSCSLRELTALCREVTGREVPVGVEETLRPGDIPWYVTDARRGRERFPWRPRRSLRTLVQDIAAWIVENREALRPVLAPGSGG